MIRPEQLPNDCGFQLFQEGIKPMWEDEANENGGRFILKIKKQFSNYFWENLILSFIGEEYQENELICGLICSTKDKEIILSIWVRQLPDQTYFNGIREWIRNSLNLSQHIEIEYRDHPKSISNGHTHEKVIGNRFGSSKPKQYDSKFHDQKKTQSGDIEV